MPKITIPATITLDLPAAAEWADIFEAVDKAKQQQPEMTTTIIAPASAKKLTPMPAAVIERLRQAGNRFVSMRNMKKHLRKQFHKRDVSNGSVHQLVHLLRGEGFEIETHPKYGGGYRLVKEAA